MKIEQTKVSGIDTAIHAMRNPMNSWHLSDSEFIVGRGFKVIVGEKDNELAMKLIKAGKDHRKFLRLINISCLLTLPRYIWTEFDTYKVGTTRLSCSTMHKLGSVSLTVDDFQDSFVLFGTLEKLNQLGEDYRENKSVETLRRMKQLLPESFLQSATVSTNYEVLMNMYHSRKNHRMVEWSGKNGICEWIESLPMMNKWLNIK